MGRSAKKGKHRSGICAYCGKSGRVTRDHIPPMGIFASPRPSNLITVPSCVACHSPWSKDDEYFRIRMCLNDQVRGHPDVTGNLESVLHALNRKEAEGMKRSLINDSRIIDVSTKGGIYLGRRSAFQVDLPRIFRVVERIVRGLYFYETKTCLALDHGVKVVSNEVLSEQDSETIDVMKNTIIAPLAAIAPRVIGQNTFSYRFGKCDIPGVSAWGLVFFGRIQFIALTGPNELRDTVSA
jgi:hypothetical protein